MKQRRSRMGASAHPTKLQYRRENVIIMKDMDTLNREDIGRRIGIIRRREGLSPTELAKALNVPATLTEIAEHGIRSDLQDEMKPTLPTNELLNLLKLMSEKFEVPLNWLTYGYDVLFYTNDVPAPDDEVTLFFPVTISPRSLSCEMNDAMILMNNPIGCAEERLSIEKNILESIVEKLHLYQQHESLMGNKELADFAGKQMLASINRHRSPYIM